MLKQLELSRALLIERLLEFTVIMKEPVDPSIRFMWQNHCLRLYRRTSSLRSCEDHLDQIKKILQVLGTPSEAGNPGTFVSLSISENMFHPLGPHGRSCVAPWGQLR